MLSFNNFISTVSDIFKYLLHRLLVVEVTTKLAEVINLKTAYSCIAPGSKLAVAVFTNNKCVNASAVNVKMFTKQIFETTCIKYSSGTNYPVRWITRFFKCNKCKNIYRVRYNKKNSTKITFLDFANN